jgi:hypothetical protein
MHGKPRVFVAFSGRLNFYVAGVNDMVLFSRDGAPEQEFGTVSTG